MLGTSKPDYGQCVDIATKSALREMVLPGLLVVGMPVAVGLVFKWLYNATGQPRRRRERRGGGGRAADGRDDRRHPDGALPEQRRRRMGQRQEVHRNRRFGGKRSDPHKAAVVGDTVGDPFKDTAGPSLHVLIKLLSTITLVLAPLFI